MTEVATGPEVGERLSIFGLTVKAMPLLEVPFTVTTTEPVVAVDGTGATMLVALHDVGVADTPLNFSVLVPWVAPKFEPLIVIKVPAVPEVAERPLIEGELIGRGTATYES